MVLLNLVRLKDLGVEYCPLLRKSEDLALCYSVLAKSGGGAELPGVWPQATC